MRILITTGIFSPDIGGPATYIPQVADALARRGHRITVLTLSDTVDHTDKKKGCFRVVRLSRRVFRPLRWLLTILVLIWLGKNTDVVFVNGLAMEAVMANVLLRRPMVHKVVGDLAWERASNRAWVRESFEDFQRGHSGLKVEFSKALRGWWTRQAERIIVPSRYLAQWVGAWGVSDEKITTIYNAVEPLDGIEKVEVPLQNPLKVVTVGRLVPSKHVEKVMETVARIDSAGLVVVGEGPERGRLEMLAGAMGIADRVYFAGQRSRNEVLGLMAACDLFVLNSSYEGFPHVLLEAMSVGLPIVATAVGGTPELIQDGKNGKLISPRDDQALFEALLELASSPSERQRLADGARRTIQSFGLRQMVGRTEAVLRESQRVLGGR